MERRGTPEDKAVGRYRLEAAQQLLSLTLLLGTVEPGHL